MPDLRDYVQHKGNCLLGRGIRPVKCPTCGEPMNPVRNHNGYLNSDQFDSVKAGDWFCKRHEAEVVYVWDHALPKHGCTCGLEAALAAAPASSPQLYPPHADCPTCHGTGESPNAQFRCHCRWHRIGCALVQGRGDCDCRRV